MNSSKYADEIPEHGDKQLGLVKFRSLDANAINDTTKPLKDESKNHPPVSIVRLFQFADTKDKVLMLVGFLGVLGVSSGLPLHVLLYGQMIDVFIDDAKNNFFPNGTTADTSTLLVDIWSWSRWYLVIAVGVNVAGYVMMTGWMVSAERQVHRIKHLYMRAVLRHNVAWFDTQNVGELSSRMVGDIDKIAKGMGEKVALFMQSLVTAVMGLLIGLAVNWILTLIILAVMPFMSVTLALLSKNVQKFVQRKADAYGAAGSIADEAFGAIRTVAAFGGEEKETQRYSANLTTAKKMGVLKGVVTGVGVGVIRMLIFVVFGLSMWYGTIQIADGATSGGDVMLVFLGVIIAGISLGLAAPHLEFVSQARGAAAFIYDLIQQEPEVDVLGVEGLRPDVRGNICLENVSFAYPSRPSVQILRNVSLSVSVGQTVALVGGSGCGKSTVTQLVQRFYDLDGADGKISVDGHDLKTINVGWLRRHIGVVAQEPVLFATTIAENIRFGGDSVSHEDMIAAATQANAHDFISQLPDKYDTLVGERGVQMSGGQKQRIAIARALARDPKILILDEATSALDTHSESVVQNALDKARRGRTTIVIAHRLSTIRNADLIYEMENGEVKGSGTHQQLMKRRNIYYALATNQMKSGNEAIVEEDDAAGKSRELQRLSSVADSVVSAVDRPHLKRNVSRLESVTVEADLKTQALRELNEYPPLSYRRLAALNRPELPFIVAGCFAAVFVGGINPIFAVLLGQLFKNFASLDDEGMRRAAREIGYVILGIGVVVSLASFFADYFLALSGERLTLRLRRILFQHILSQDVGWFDDSKNGVGALTSKLSVDADRIQGVAGPQAGILVQALATTVGALFVAFYFGWELALIVLAFIPLMLFGGALQGRVMSGNIKQGSDTQTKANSITSESFGNIRTVASLTLQETMIRKYKALSDAFHRQTLRKLHVFGVTFGFSQSVLYYSICGSITAGAWLTQIRRMEFYNVFRVYGSIIFSGSALGQAFSLALDVTQAKLAAARIFSLLDRKPEIDSSEATGFCPSEYVPSVCINDVHFVYPSRPEARVLQGLHLSVEPGKSLALVGTSGCGKSTTVSLLERFYRADSGTMSLGEHDIERLNVRWLRSQMGLVSQEPTLFDISIRDNIAYGDNSRNVEIGEIVESAKSANIHDFITSLPQGYETNVGNKGTQLSGGQKQRVAIARALLRKPNVLLLDEATSALDTESERIVQEALDRARVGRTCIVIAHRLSTIRNADAIAVVQDGRVVECGTHEELMKRQEFYFRLQNTQKQ